MTRRDWGRAALTSLALSQRGTVRGAATQAEDGRAYRYIHLDVFTNRRLAGNQLLVFPQPAGLDAEAMLQLTRESNYSECTFVFPPEQKGINHRVRIFMRSAEIPFAGHPTIGTAFALAHAGVLEPGAANTVFGLGIGPTNIDLQWSGTRLAFAWMTQVKPTFGKTIDDAKAVASAIGVDVGAVQVKANAPTRIPAAQEVNTGSTFLIVPVTTREAVDAATLDRAKIDAVFAAAGIQRRGVYVFSTERGQDDATAYSRLLGSGGIEDPATGSAAGPAGAFMAKYGLVPPERADAIVFLQGVLVGRPSRIHVRVGLTGADTTSVKVGGIAVVVGEGTMSV